MQNHSLHRELPLWLRLVSSTHYRVCYQATACRLDQTYETINENGKYPKTGNAQGSRLQPGMINHVPNNNEVDPRFERG